VQQYDTSSFENFVITSTESYTWELGGIGVYRVTGDRLSEFENYVDGWTWGQKPL